MNYFYCKNIESNIIELDAEESRHCALVLRMRSGQIIGIVDGKGTFCEASLLEVNPSGTVASVTRRTRQYGKRPFFLHLAVAPTKSIDRFEWLLEKSTECGVDEITPIISEKSERRIIKPQRLEKIIIAAMKQSGRAYLPKLNPIITFGSFIEQPVAGTAMVAHCSDADKQTLTSLYKPGNDSLVLIGPEGGFTDQEVSHAINRGFHAISLGTYRLRTETAAITACIQLNTANGLL